MDKKIEYTYVMIKPDVSNNELCVSAIKKMLKGVGMDIVLTMNDENNPNGYLTLTDEILEQHYGHVKQYGEGIYETLVNFMKSGYVIPMVLKGENAISAVRTLIGPTDSTKAEPFTVRGLFGTNKTMNAIHASDSKESAEIEIKRFFGLSIEDLENSKTFSKKI